MQSVFLERRGLAWFLTLICNLGCWLENDKGSRKRLDIEIMQYVKINDADAASLFFIDMYRIAFGNGNSLERTMHQIPITL